MKEFKLTISLIIMMASGLVTGLTINADLLFPGMCALIAFFISGICLGILIGGKDETN